MTTFSGGLSGTMMTNPVATAADVTGEAVAPWRKLWRGVFGKKRRGQIARLLGHHPATGSKWSRIVMEQETRRLVAALHPENLTCLEISGDAWKEFGFKGYTQTQYPQFDICEHVLPQQFDFIVADQVFEHLLWPYRAGKHVFQMLKPGRYFLVTTPFM